MNLPIRLLSITLALFTMTALPVLASFDGLPRDMQVTILLRAEPGIKDLGNYALVSKRWHDVSASDELWGRARTVYLPFELDFYKQYSKAVRKIFSKESKRVQKIARQLSSHFPLFKLMVIWREAIARDFVQVSARLRKQTVPNDSELSKCLVAAELAGNGTPLFIYTENWCAKRVLGEHDSFGETFRSDVLSFFDKYINLGSKLASEKKKSYEDHKIL